MRKPNKRKKSSRCVVVVRVEMMLDHLPRVKERADRFGVPPEEIAIPALGVQVVSVRHSTYVMCTQIRGVR